jgi:hypothetical protein
MSYWQSGFWLMSILLIITLLFLVYKTYGKSVREYMDSGLSVGAHIRSKEISPRNEKGTFYEHRKVVRQSGEYSTPRSKRLAESPPAPSVAIATPVAVPVTPQNNGILSYFRGG